MFYEIYGLSQGRDAATVERFLHHFCQREQLEPLVNQWLQVWTPDGRFLDEVERPLTSVAEVVSYATAHPTHGFVWYQLHAVRADLHSVLLRFTSDAQVVFGLCIAEQQPDGSDNLAQAQQLLTELRHVTAAHNGYIAVEYPPAATEAEFEADRAMWRMLNE